MQKVLVAQADVDRAARQINEALCLAILRLRPTGIRAGDVAARAGISHSRLSRLQNGWESPPLEVAERVAAAVGEPVDELFPAVFSPLNEVTAAGAGDRDGKAGRRGVHESG
jgi:transcriptional regulator with XRE-family HTH domain